MALIDTTTLLNIADRAAAQYKQVAVPFESINATGVSGAEQFYWQMVTATDDPDVEIPLLSPYYTVDTSGFSTQTLIRSGVPGLTTIVSTMDTHFNRVSLTGSWDGYCTQEDVQVSDYFNLLYFAARSTYLLANNVFSESDDTFATLDIAAGPVLNFTDGVDYGDGDATNRADGTNFAPTQLRMKVDVAAAGAALGADIDLTLNVKDPDNNPTTINVTVPSGTAVGAYVSVGTSSDIFLDVTGASFNGGQGQVGDEVTVHNLKQREIPDMDSL